MTVGAAPHDDPRAELAELAAAVRAYVEQQQDTGASGLPADAGAAALLDALGGGGAPARPAVRAAPPAHEGGRPAVPAFAAPEWSAPRPLAPPPAAARPAPAPPPAPAAPAPAPVAASPSADAGERVTRLALLAEEARACTRCVLHEQRRQAVFSRGDPFSELCFVGEGPGADEDAQGFPFVGAAGQLLDRMIAAMGYARDAVYICNVVKCRPPNNRKPEPEEMASCMPYLVQQLALIQPKVIVALGATAVQGLFGTTEGITRMRGKWKLYKGSTPLMPTFHPAYLLRNPAAKREVWADLQEVMKHLGRPAPPAREVADRGEPAILPAVARVAFVVAGLFPWALTLLRAYLPLGAFGVAADAVFAAMCHRLPERTLVLAGVAMPLCSRCAGIFAGAAVGALAARPRLSPRGHRLLITAAGAAMLLDVATQDLGVHPVWHATRLATGFLFGYAVGAASLVALIRAAGEGGLPDDRPPSQARG